jgi:hypothetical protein
MCLDCFHGLRNGLSTVNLRVRLPEQQRRKAREPTLIGVLPSLERRGGDMGLYCEGNLYGAGRTGCFGIGCSAAKYCEFQLPVYKHL